MASQKPIVSIIIPTRDRAGLLAQTLDSVFNQSYGVLQVIVVDDGSSDDTVAYVLKRAEKQPGLFVHRRTGTAGGPQICRNQGLQQATGEYVILLDSDDLLASDCLEARVEFMESRPGLDFAVFPCAMFDQTPGDLPRMWNSETGENDLDRFLKIDSPWALHSVIWKRESLVRLGGMDESLQSWHDWELHLRALCRGLRYDKGTTTDCYCRVPQVGVKTVGQTSNTAAYFSSKRGLLEKILGLLSDAGLLDQSRRKHVVRLAFWCACNSAQRSDVLAAKDFWGLCRRHGLIGPLDYAVGGLYLATRYRPVTRYAAYAMLEWTWSSRFRLEFSRTLRRAPVSVALT